MRKYSSLTAFLEHWRALETTQSLRDDEREQLASMRAILDALPAPERRALASSDSAGETRRLRERAERRLSRELAVRGILET